MRPALNQLGDFPLARGEFLRFWLPEFAPRKTCGGKEKRTHSGQFRLEASKDSTPFRPGSYRSSKRRLACSSGRLPPLPARCFLRQRSRSGEVHGGQVENESTHGLQSAGSKFRLRPLSLASESPSTKTTSFTVAAQFPLEPVMHFGTDAHFEALTRVHSGQMRLNQSNSSLISTTYNDLFQSA